MKFYRLLLLFVLTVIVTSSSAQIGFGQSSAELKRRKEKLNDELDELNREYDKVRKDKSVSIKQLNILKAQINVREDKIKTINSEVRNLDNQISENTNTVHTLQGQLDQLKKDYAGMVLFAYHNKSAYNKLMFVFAANDFNQAYKRLKYLQQFGNYRQRQAESIQGTQKDLGVKINQLDRSKQEKRTLLQDEEEKKTLDRQRSDQAVVVSKLSKQQGYIKQQQASKRTQINSITRQISAAIRREIAEARRKAEAEARERAAAERARAAAAEKDNKPAPVAANKPKEITKNSSNSDVLNATPEAARLSNDFLGNRGSLPWPVTSGSVSQGFGKYYIEGILTENTGIDIRTSSGATVRAVFNGEVSNVVNVSGTYLVVIRHGEYFTAYSNLRSASVARGQKVTTKQAVGVVATDGSTGETEVHFDLYKGQTPVNPQIWLAPDK